LIWAYNILQVVQGEGGLLFVLHIESCRRWNCGCFDYIYLDLKVQSDFSLLSFSLCLWV